MTENNRFCNKCGSLCKATGFAPDAAQATALHPHRHTPTNSAGYAGNGFAGNDYAVNGYAVDNLDYSRLFTNPKEQYITSLGNGYLANFLTSGSIGNGFAVVSDKMVYFRGNMINIEGKTGTQTDLQSSRS